MDDEQRLESWLFTYETFKLLGDEGKKAHYQDKL